jgi:uncharacterized membrane protein YqiK
VSLTGLDQTSFKFFNPQNAFDAEGLTKLTETIEDRRKKRNDIEQDADLAIRAKNLEAERARLEISREEEYAKLQQEREISIRKAEQTAEIASQEAGKNVKQKKLVLLLNVKLNSNVLPLPVMLKMKIFKKHN